MRRVVVTGLGLVTPLACGVEETWTKLVAGQSGARKITKFNTEDLATKIACDVPRGDGSNGTFNPDQWIDPKEQRRIDDFIGFGLAAAQQAVTDSGWKPANDEERCRTGVLIGSGIGGLPGIADASITLHDKGPRRISPFFITGRLINLVSGYASIQFGYKGPNHSVVTACATGAHALGDAARMIALDDADLMLCGGAEAAISRLGIAGFNACRALSTAFNETPERASRPYDKQRDGFVMGEGAGMVMLEEYEHAKARGAKIYGELVGYGMSGDAFHITAPAEDGNGGFRAMQMALKRSGLAVSDIDYVNAHGTSTMADGIELAAVERFLGNSTSRVLMSSTKSSIGHLLGAAGAVEAIFCLLAMRDHVVPPTLNLEEPDVETGIDLVPLTAKKHDVSVALSNSFGFGGTNAALIFTAPH
jgi:3-oxoacyl-[acyl-carrier-protein] synthase II